jgi:predicted SAM-dependent methyltransferase
MYKSETAKLRDILAPFCKGDGIDLGCGSDKIIPSAIGIDLPQPYAHCGDDPIQIHTDARALPFKDNTLDYIYSSHLWEDFSPKDGKNVRVIFEWLRVLKNGGLLILNLPHEKIFKGVCYSTGQPYNQAHQCEEMSPEYVKDLFDEYFKDQIEWVLRTDVLQVYCFAIVIRKKVDSIFLHLPTMEEKNES